LRAALGRFAGAVAPDVPVLSVIKGMEIATFRRPSEIIRESLGERRVATFGGPGHAEEIGRSLPTSLVAASEDFAAVLDSLIVCKFLRKCFTDFYAEASDLLNKVTGWSCSSADLRRVGERINTLKKLFNVREGWKPEDDWLPARILTETLPTGVARGVGLTETELRQMIQGYYGARGWDERGLIPDKKLRELGLQS